MESLETFQSQIEEQIKRFNSKRYRAKHTHYALAIMGNLASVSVTIVVGWKCSTGCEVQLSNTALVLSGGANILVFLATVFRARERLMLYTSVVSRLKSIRARLAYEVSKRQLDADTLDVFYEEFHRALSESNSEWQRTMRVVKKKKNDK